MSESRFPRRTIDDEIDRAVRELVALEPRPGLRRRVLSRLEQRASDVGFGRRLFVPAAALLALIVAALVWRPGITPATPDVVVQNPAPDSAPAAVIPPSTAASSQSAAPESKAAPPTTRAVGAPNAMFGRPSGRVTATSLAGSSATRSDGAGADSLPPAETREDVPGAFAPIAIAPIRIAPLELRRLSVPPLSGRQ